MNEKEITLELLKNNQKDISKLNRKLTMACNFSKFCAAVAILEFAIILDAYIKGVKEDKAAKEKEENEEKEE